MDTLDPNASLAETAHALNIPIEALVWLIQTGGGANAQTLTEGVSRIHQAWYDAGQPGAPAPRNPNAAGRPGTPEEIAEFETRGLQWLEQLLKEGAKKDNVLLGLAGCESRAALDFRSRLIQGGDKETRAIGAHSLRGCPSAAAMEMRRYLHGKDLGSTSDALAGRETPETFDIRNMEIQKDPGWVCQSLVGCDGPRAHELREQLASNGQIRYLVLASLAGCDSERSWIMRKRLARQLCSSAVDNGDRTTYCHQLERWKGWLGISLSGCDSPLAWSLREKLMDECAYRNAPMLSLAGLSSERAWNMREELRKEGPGNVFFDLPYSIFGGLENFYHWKVGLPALTSTPVPRPDHARPAGLFFIPRLRSAASSSPAPPSSGSA